MRKTGFRKLTALLLTAVLLTGCTSAKKKKEEALADYALCEHIVSIDTGAGTISDNAVLDVDGFYVVKDNVYANADSLNIRMAPSTDSKLVTIAPYGTRLQRTGIGQEGWDRVEYEGDVCYVTHSLVTVVPIQSTKTFEFSTVALNIVETKRQQYTYDDLCQDVEALRQAFGSKMKLNSIGFSADNRSIFEIVIGSNNAKKDIYYVAGLCGAEYMTSMVIMKQVEYYLHYYDAGYYNGYAFSDLFDNVRVHVIPMLNPDSVQVSQLLLQGVSDTRLKTQLKEWYDRDQSAGGINLNLENYLRFFYANAEGTDLRRNFPYQWDLANTVAEPASNGYRGRSEGSSAEVKAILNSIRKNDPSIVVAYHTTGSKIFYQYSQRDDVLSKAKSYGYTLSKMMTYELSEKKLAEDGYGTLAGFCNNVEAIPALTINLGNGSAPLSLSEFNAIWNAMRDSWAELQVTMIEW